MHPNIESLKVNLARPGKLITYSPADSIPNHKIKWNWH